MGYLSEEEVNKRYAESLERLRFNEGLTQAEFAKSLGMALATYKRFVSGETQKISVHVAYMVWQKYGKTLPDMINFESEMADLVKKAQELSKTQRAYINAMIDFERQFKPQSASNDTVLVYVPTGNMQDGMIYDSAYVEEVNIADYRKTFGDRISYGVRITSNHLHPVYNEGDILLICAEPLRDGDTGLFSNKEDKRVYIRKFKQGMPCRLVPLNGMGKEFLVDPTNPADMEKWYKLGYVLTKLRT